MIRSMFFILCCFANISYAAQVNKAKRLDQMNRCEQLNHMHKAFQNEDENAYDNLYQENAEYFEKGQLLDTFFSAMIITEDTNLAHTLAHHKHVTIKHLAANALLKTTMLPEMVHIFLNAGTDIKAINDKLQTALHLAIEDYAQEPHQQMVSLKEANREFIKTLIIAGCPIDAKDIEGNTALSDAIKQGRLDLITLFISRGADLNLIQDACKAMLTHAKPKRAKLQEAIKKGHAEFAYYQQQRKLAEEQNQLAPVITNIIKDYTFDEVPENLHAQESEKKSWCIIQ